MPILNELTENDKIIIETNLTLVRYCAKLLHAFMNTKQRFSNVYICNKS